MILHQQRFGWVLIMELLDLNWYSRLLGFKFVLSHSDLLCFGLSGFQHAIETCCASAEEVR